MASAWPKETTISYYGIFMTSFSTRAARKGGMPILSAAFIGTRDEFLRNRGCDRDGPERNSILNEFFTGRRETVSQVATLLRQRHSTRVFDDQRPITIDELSRFLEGTAPVLSEGTDKHEFGNDGPAVGYTVRPYPSAGASFELELYLAVDKCEGLRRGFYHYDAGEHGLVSIKVRNNQLEAMLMKGAFAMGAPSPPQILITIAARFGQISWKYSSIAYALILKDVGVLTQTFYLMATDLGLGGCAIGIANIDLFARMTGLKNPRGRTGRSICAWPRATKRAEPALYVRAVAN